MVLIISINVLAILLYSRLSQDMVPPKDPYVKVRVLDDIGEVVLSDQVANLARHAMLFLRRTDAEQYISQVLTRPFLHVTNSFISPRLLTSSLLFITPRA